MAIGPGKYDDEATRVREATKAAVAVVLIADGEHGSGFSIQIDAARCMPAGPSAVLAKVADALEACAIATRADAKKRFGS